MQLPEGYEAHVAPRSSTFKNFGVIQTNHMGVIDNSYSGDNDIWRFPALAIRNTVIIKGDRICQFRIVEKQPSLEFVEVETLGNDDRGGFGLQDLSNLRIKYMWVDLFLPTLEVYNKNNKTKL